MRDLMVASELAIGGRVIRERAEGIMVSPGVPAEAARRLGFTPAASAPDALEIALARTGRAAGVLVLRHGGEILPRVAGE
jgi:hypothetical protein